MDVLQILYVIGAYLLGSVNSAILVSKAFSLPDPRSLGSGNPGATNVLRTGNKLAAGITLVGDLLKGLVPVILAEQLSGYVPLVAATGVAALLGHMYPLYYRFKGGKGVATTLGVLIGFDWVLAIIWAICWLVIAWLSRFSSLAALLATTFTLIASYFIVDNTNEKIWFVTAIAIIALFVFWRHRENIKKLIAGTESKIGSKK